MRNVTVTRQNADGTYDEVGMRERFLCHLKTQRGIINRCHRMGWISGKIRMEWANGYDKPYSTTYARLEQGWY